MIPLPPHSALPLSLTLDHPWVLLLLVLLPVPLLRWPYRGSDHPALDLVPPDGLSRLVGLGLRAAGFSAGACLILALAGPVGGGQTVTRQGLGANIVLLLDRSSSMDNSFADQQPDGREEAKSATAKRLLLDFVNRRPRDRIGVAAFSTAPLRILPMTDHRDAVRAAISAMDRPGLAYTDVGRGLALAIGLFGERTAGESRALILVSDGAGVIEREVQAMLRSAFARTPVNLYWLFIRSRGSNGLQDAPADGTADTPQTRPERHLHLFLQTLGVPYRALEAQSPQAVADAIAEIDRLEAKPITYHEMLPRRDLAPLFYRLAAVFTGLLLLAALAERTLVPAGAGRLPLLRSRWERQ